MREPHRILITGATDGIGLALAQIYKAKGERPLLLGRKSWSELSQETMDWEKFPPADKVAAGIVKAIDGKRPFTTIGAGNQLVGMAGRWPCILPRRAIGFAGLIWMRCERLMWWLN